MWNTRKIAWTTLKNKKNCGNPCKPRHSVDCGRLLEHRFYYVLLKKRLILSPCITDDALGWGCGMTCGGWKGCSTWLNLSVHWHAIAAVEHPAWGLTWLAKDETNVQTNETTSTCKIHHEIHNICSFTLGQGHLKLKVHQLCLSCQCYSARPGSLAAQPLRTSWLPGDGHCPCPRQSRASHPRCTWIPRDPGAAGFNWLTGFELKLEPDFWRNSHAHNGRFHFIQIMVPITFRLEIKSWSLWWYPIAMAIKASHVLVWPCDRNFFGDVSMSVTFWTICLFESER